MFGLFRPTCPVEAPVKAWLETRAAWLLQEFGPERLLRRPVILPTPEFFPDEYDGSDEAVRRMFERVCGYMGVDPDPIELEFYSDEGGPPLEDHRGHRTGAAGLYERGEGVTIWIELSRRDDPLALVGTMAHELGHELLLGEGRVTSDTEDHEPLTDLLTVFSGLGVFTANSSLHESYWQTGQWAGWSIGRRGYLDQRSYGYALALFALARREPKPSWTKGLRLDVRSAFQQGVRYITKTGDCSLAQALTDRADG
jgi:hypothetical protein